MLHAPIVTMPCSSIDTSWGMAIDANAITAPASDR